METKTLLFYSPNGSSCGFKCTEENHIVSETIKSPYWTITINQFNDCFYLGKFKMYILDNGVIIAQNRTVYNYNNSFDIFIHSIEYYDGEDDGNNQLYIHYKILEDL